MAKKKGRPLKYKQEFCDLLIEHLSRGLSYESFAADLDVTRDCLYKWEKQYPDFLYAKKVGQEKMTKFYEQMGIALMTGKLKGNVTAWIFLCKNKIGYADKTEITGNTDKPLTLKYALDDSPVTPNTDDSADE
jgi:hypothetical protein